MADFFILRQPAATWTAQNPILLLNQIGVETDLRNNVETDTSLAKLGNGIDTWNDLPYWPTPAEPGVDGIGYLGIPSISWGSDLAANASNVGKSFDAPLGQTGGFTLTINDGATYDNSPAWSGSNLSNSTLIVTLLNTPANLYLIDGTAASHGAMDVASGGAFVVRKTADGIFVITGTGVTVD